MPKPPFRKIGICMKSLRDQSPEPVLQLFDYLEQKGLRICLDEEATRLLGRGQPCIQGDHWPAGLDLVIVLGGDGTLLSIARNLPDPKTPILGINFGSLGFLTVIPRDQMRAMLDDLFAGRFRIEDRMRLQVEVHREGRLRESFSALNDAVINYGAFARIIDLKVFVDGQFLTNYRSDGLIVSTPTGSTAYALSAGGPILVPSTRSLILAPICPHTLTHRPIVLDGTSAILIEVAGGGNVVLTVDGQTGISLAREDQVRVRQSDQVTRLVIPEQVVFFDILRQKLKWGER